MLLYKFLFYFGFYDTLQAIVLLWVLCCLTSYCLTFGFYDTLQAIV